MWLAIIVVAVIAGSIADRYFEHRENMEAIKNGASLERTSKKE